MFTEEVMCNSDMSGIFGSCVIIGKINARPVILVNRYGAFDKLARNAFKDIDEP